MLCTSLSTTSPSHRGLVPRTTASSSSLDTDARRPCLVHHDAPLNQHRSQARTLPRRPHRVPAPSSQHCSLPHPHRRCAPPSSSSWRRTPPRALLWGRFARCPWPRGATPCRPPFSPRKRVRATTVPRSASPSGPCARSPGLLSQPRRDAKLCIPSCAPAPARWPPLRRAKPQRRHAPTSSPPRLYLCYLDDGSSPIAIASRLPCCSATAAAPHRNSSRPPVSSPQAQAFTFLRFYKPFLTIPCHELQAVASTSTSPAFFLSVEAATS